MKPATFLEEIRQYIGSDELAQALQQLRQFLSHSPQIEEVLQQSGRFAAICKQIRLGTVSHEDATLTRNQIRAALLELLDELEVQQAQSLVLGQEMERAVALVDSKNTVVNSNITAGGDIHIGDKQIKQQAENIYNIDKIDQANFS